MSRLVDKASLMSYLEDNTVPEDILVQAVGGGNSNNSGPSLALGTFIGGGVGLKVGGTTDAINAWKGAGSDASTGEKLKAASSAGVKGGAKFGALGAAVGTGGMLVDDAVEHRK